MKKIVVLIFYYLVFAGAFAQQADSTNTNDNAWKDRLILGGDLGLLFGTTTLIDISPIVGYRVSDRVTFGVGPIYQYYNFNTVAGRFETHTYGGRGLVRYNFSTQFFAHAEYQLINLEALNTFNNELERVNVPLGLIGGGYLQEIGGGAFLNIQVLFDVIEDINSPYQNPIFRAGFIYIP